MGVHHDPLRRPYISVGGGEGIWVGGGKFIFFQMGWFKNQVLSDLFLVQFVFVFTQLSLRMTYVFPLLCLVVFTRQ